MLKSLKHFIERHFLYFPNHIVQHCIFTCAILTLIISVTDKILGKKTTGITWLWKELSVGNYDLNDN